MSSPVAQNIISSTRQRRYAISLPLHLSERKILLGLLDVLVLNSTLMLVTAWRMDQPWGPSALRSHLPWYVLLTAIAVLVGLLVDGYNLRRASRLITGVPLGAGVSFLTCLAYLSIPHFTPWLNSSRLAILTFTGGSVAGVALWRGLYASVLSQPSFRRRVIVVGAGASGQAIVQAIRTFAPTEYEFAGFLDDNPVKLNGVIEGLPVIGTRRDLLGLVSQTATAEVIVAITHADQIDPELFEAIVHCHERGVTVTQMALLYEQLTGRVPVEYIGQNLHVLIPINGHPNRLYKAAKRMADIVIGVAGLLATGLMLPFVAVGLQIESPGPVFYRQVRLGRGGRPFALFKFRTMVADAEADGPRWAEERDGRATRIGRLLRVLHLDELPQAINILRGDLSFIGPRPERPEFARELEEAIPFYRARYAVRPGVTGWAQVNYRYGASVGDALVKLQYDLYYIKHQSFWLDLFIALKTLGVLLTLQGR